MNPTAGFSDLPDLILFDGNCALCSAWVRFVLARDRAEHWRFVPIQSRLGRDLAERFGIDPADPQTNAVVRNGAVHLRLASVEAVLRDWPAWRWILMARILPQRVRDTLYDAVARNRYRLFGRTCLVPAPRWADRVVADPDRLPQPTPLWPDDPRLPEAVRRIHAGEVLHLSGRAEIEGGTTRLARGLARIAGFPPAGADVPVTVRMERRGGEEIWTRVFAGRTLVSRIIRSPRPDARIRESLRGLTCDIALTTKPYGQVWLARGWSLAGFPLPARLAPEIGAIEGVDAQGRYRFSVVVRWGRAGRLVAYKGWLVPTENPQPL